VMEAAHLLPLVRHQLRALLHGYIQAQELDRDVASYVVAPLLGRRSGVIGALVLAARAAGNAVV